MSIKNEMTLINTARTLQSAGRPITPESLNDALKANGLEADPAEIDALLALIGKAEEAPRRARAGNLHRPGSGTAPDPGQQALYVYAVAVGEPVPFETAGLGGAKVFAVTEDGLTAVVHQCPAQPYSSQDKETVREWVLSHQAVMEEASRCYEAVLPMAFDTMVSGEDSRMAAEQLRRWLRDEGDALRRKVDRVRNREEYGVQVFWDVESATREVMDTCPAIVECIKGLDGKSEGAAYLHKQLLEKLVRDEMRRRTETVFRQAFDLAGQHAAEVCVDRLKSAEGNMRMVANLSCLVDKGRSEALKASFDEHCAGDGLEVRVTGPWPPYSFV